MSTKPVRVTLFTLVLLFALLISALPAAAAPAIPGAYQVETPDRDNPTLSPPADETPKERSVEDTATVAVPPTVQDTPTVEPVVESTPEANQAATQQQETPAPVATIRPILLIESFSTNPSPITPGQSFTLDFLLRNAADASNPQEGLAYNVVITFAPGDILPSGSGGMLTIPEQRDFDAGTTVRLNQTFTASSSLEGQTQTNLVLNVDYTDKTGAAYTSSFTLGLSVAKKPVFSGPAQPTATPTAILRPQLVISGYKIDSELLQPGTPFELTLDVRNLGSSDAKSVTMVMGGGAASGGTEGTPQPGGVSGAGGEFTNFAPLESSNIQFLGDIPAGADVDGVQPLIVNVTTNPGAYSVKFSFIYLDAKGNRFTDDQVITLLVYSLPQVEFGFYRDPGIFMVGQPMPIPLQVVNLGRKSAVLGNMKATVEMGGQMMNNTMFVGPLEPGNFFTFDPTFIPEQAGPLDISVTVSYTDDFNQPRSINQVLSVMVEDMPIFEPGDNGGFPPDGEGPMEPIPTTETFWQKVVRFFKGLVGLDSSVPQPVNGEGPMGPIEGPFEEPPIIEPVPGKG